MDNQTLYKALDSILSAFTKEPNWLLTKVYYSDLRDTLDDNTKDILSVSLEKLIEDGYIVKEQEEEPYTLQDFALGRNHSYVTVYQLTIKGVEFINSGGYSSLDLTKSLSLKKNIAIPQPKNSQKRFCGILRLISEHPISSTLISTGILSIITNWNKIYSWFKWLFKL